MVSIQILILWFCTAVVFFPHFAFWFCLRIFFSAIRFAIWFIIIDRNYRRKTEKKSIFIIMIRSKLGNNLFVYQNLCFKELCVCVFFFLFLRHKVCKISCASLNIACVCNSLDSKTTTHFKFLFTIHILTLTICSTKNNCRASILDFFSVGCCWNCNSWNVELISDLSHSFVSVNVRQSSWCLSCVFY